MNAGMNVLKAAPGAAEIFNTLYFGGLDSAPAKYAEVVEKIREYDAFRASLPVEMRWTPTPNSFTIARNIPFLGIQYGDANWKQLRELEEAILAAASAVA